MATNVGNASVTLELDTRKASQQFRRFNQEIGRANRNVNGLGSITQDARKFESALGAATNRVTAFAAAAVVFNTVKNAVSAFASAVVDVDKSLAQINVNLGQSAQGLKKFGADLFSVARQTGQTFEVAAKAAEELARQGLSATETTERLKNALILSRIAGIGSADAVDTLTAAINSFNKSALTSSEVVNKFAAVDTRFAVSSKDLAEAISRVGSTAQSAGVGIDELVALVTSLQQTTARGGATIGNGLKTIFTRIQAAPETINALQSLGISIKDNNGNLRSAIDILRDYTKARDRVGEAERASLDRTVAGTFQANILKAAIGDLGREYSVYDSALRASNGATDEAIRKNEELNKTLSSLINSTAVSIKQLFANIGDRSLSPLLNELLSTFERARQFLTGETGSKMGEALGDGILKGITNVLSGPVFVGLLAILGKAFAKIAITIKQEAQALISLNNTAAVRAKIQERINFLLANATQAENAQFRAASSVLAQKQAILAIQQRIAATEITGTPLANAFVTRGALLGVPSSGGLSAGRLPRFADPIASAVARESQASGLPTSQIYVDRDSRVANFANPAGILIANRRDEPSGGFQGVNRVLASGGNPKTNGVVPNFAPVFPAGSLKTKAGQFAPVSEINQLFAQLSKIRLLGDDFNRFGSQIQDLSKNLNKVSQSRVISKLSQEFNKAYIASKIVDDETRRVPYVTPTGGRVDESRAVMDRNVRHRFMSSGPSMLGPAYPINPELAARLASRHQTIRWANAGIEPTTQYDSPIGPPTYRDYRTQRLGAAVNRGAEKARIEKARLEQRRQTNSNRALYGGFALSFAGGFIPEGEGGTGKGIGLGAAQTATQVAGIGGIFGPKGLLIGAGIGALLGAFSKLSKSVQELSLEFDEVRVKETKRVNDLAQFIQTQEEYETALSEGDFKNANILAQRQKSILSGSAEETKKIILASGGSTDALKESLSQDAQKNSLNELKRQAVLKSSPLTGLSANIVGASKKDIESFAKTISELADLTGNKIGNVSYGRDGGNIENIRKIYKDLGIEVEISSETISTSLITGLKLAQEELSKTGKVSFETARNLSKVQEKLVVFSTALRSANIRQDISGTMFAGRQQRNAMRGEYATENLFPFATVNQRLGLRGREDAIRATGASDAANFEASGKFRQELRESLKPVFDNLSADDKGKVFNDRTSVGELQKMAEMVLGKENLALKQSILDYNGALDKSRVALEQNLKTIEEKTKLEKETAEVIRAQRAFSSGSTIQASEGSRGLRAFYNPVRDKKDQLRQEEAFTNFFNEMQGMDADVSALTPLANKSTARTNREKFLIEAEQQIQSILGPRNLKDYSGNVRESGIDYAAKELSRYQDPYKKSVGQFILDNLKAQEENTARAGKAQGKIKGALGEGTPLSPEDTLNKQLEATAKLQETLSAFSQKTINVALDINTQVEVISNGIDAFNESEFKEKATAVLRKLTGEVMALKGKPVPPSPDKSSDDFYSFYGIPKPPS